MDSQIDREVDDLDRQLESGLISSKEHARQTREIMRDFQAAAEESAEEAYRRELDQW